MSDAPDDPQLLSELEALEKQLAELREANALQKRRRGALRRIRVIPPYLGHLEIGDQEGTLDLSGPLEDPTAGPPSTPGIGAATCESLAGAGDLVGWSKLDNQDVGDWSLRKYGRVTYTVPQDTFTTQRNWTSSSGVCTGSSAPVFYHRHDDYDETPGDLIEDFGGPSGGRVTLHAYRCDASSEFLNGEDTLAPWASSTLQSAFFEFNRVTTDLTDYVDLIYSAASCFAGSLKNCAGVNYFDYDREAFSYSRASALSIPYSVYDALAAGTSTPGSTCLTTAGSIDSTSAGSTTAIAISGTTAVKVTQPLTGLTPGQTYEIDIVLERYGAGGGSLVDEIVDTVAFIAGSSAEDLTYHVPVNTDYDYKFDHAENLVQIS